MRPILLCVEHPGPRCPPVKVKGRAPLLSAIFGSASSREGYSDFMAKVIAIIWVLIWLLVLVDILRRPDLSASRKVLWALAALVLPVVGVIVYLVARPGQPTDHAPVDRYAASGEASQDR